MTVVDHPIYYAGGGYGEVSDALITTVNGDQIRIKSSLEGSWKFDGKIIYVKFDRGQFLSSDNPGYSVAAGQNALDAQLLKKNWAKRKVLELGMRLVTRPVDPMYKDADVVVTCTKEHLQ